MGEVDRIFRLGITRFDELCGKWEYPLIEGTNHVPSDLISFNYVLNSKKQSDLKKGVHFYIDDYQFERVWNRPETYIPLLTKYDCLVTPDFSIYRELPTIMQMWNVFRSRCIGHLAEKMGMKVIINLMWSGPDSYDYCFDGLPKNRTVALSTVGSYRDTKKDKLTDVLFREGLEEALTRLEPSNIIIYGVPIKGLDFRGIPIHYIANHNSVDFTGRRKKEEIKSEGEI